MATSAYTRGEGRLSTRAAEEVAEKANWSEDLLCTAQRSDGERCKGPAMRGQRVCFTHGGGTPGGRAAGARRLATLIDPALDAIYRILTSPKSKDADVLRAAENVFDRAGLPRRNEVGLDDMRATLLERLSAMEVHEVVPGEVEAPARVSLEKGVVAVQGDPTL